MEKIYTIQDMNELIKKANFRMVGFGICTFVLGFIGSLWLMFLRTL